MNRVQRFVGRLLEQDGALVETIEPEGLEVVLPLALQQVLELPEWSRLGFGQALPNRAQRVSLEAGWLERLERVVGPRGRWSQRVLAPVGTPPGKPERALAHGLELLNATYRMIRVRPAWTRYQIHAFHYSALSDEKRDGVIRLGFNLANGATLDGVLEPMLAALDDSTVESDPAAPLSVLPARWDHRRIAEILERALPSRIDDRLQRFFANMRRRQERDLSRLHAYHRDLMRESGHRAARAVRHDSSADALEGERHRRDAIAREYRAKVADLRQKYAVKVQVEWIQTVELVLPVQRFELEIRRRKGTRSFSLDWNVLARRLEQAPCEYAFTPDRPREVCDEALHLVSPDAHGPCPGCASQYCRACHPSACPRCEGRPRRPQQRSLAL